VATQIESLAILIQADPAPAIKDIGKVQTEIGAFGKSLSASSNVMASVGMAAGEALAGGFTLALEAGKAVISTINGIADAFTGPGIASTIAQTAQLADNLGLTTEALASFQHAAKGAGLSPGELDGGLLKLQKTLSGVEFGSEAVSKKLETFGVNIKGLSEQDALQVIADKFVGMTDHAEQAGLALAAFGKSGQGMSTFLKQAAGGGLQDMIARGQALGITFGRDAAAGVEKARAAMFDYEAAIQGFKTKLVIAAAPVLTPLFDQLSRGLGAASAEWSKFLDMAGPTLQRWAQQLTPWLDKVGAALKELFGDGEVLRAAWGALSAVIEGSVKWIILTWEGLAKVGGFLLDLAQVTGTLAPITNYLFPKGSETTIADFKERLTDLLATIQFVVENSRDAWKLVWLGIQFATGALTDMPTLFSRVWAMALKDITANIKNFGSAVVKFLKNPAGGFDFAPTFSNAYEYAFSESTLKIKAEADGLFKDLKDKYDKFRNDLRSKPALDFLNSGLGIKVTHNSPGGAAAGTFEPSKFGAAALLGSSEALNAEAKFRFELGGGPASPAEKQLDAQQKGNGLLQDIKQLLKQQGAAPVEFAIG
jgi:hypothetical protein